MRFGFLALFFGLVPGIVLGADPFLPTPVSDYGGNVSTLFNVLMLISAIFFVLVVGLLFYMIIRFRAKKSQEDGPAIHGHVGLEILWTVVPTAILVVLAIVSTGLVFVQLEPPKSTLVVKVTAKQFSWDFAYYETSSAVDAKVEEIHNICGNPAVFVRIKSLGVKTTDSFELPVNRPIRFIVTSADVVHSFWIPEFLIKRDTVPGLNADIWTTIDRTGDFLVRCAYLCGASHGEMVAPLKVVPLRDFDNWIASKQTVAVN